MDNNKKKKVTVAAITVFVVAILGLGMFYLMADTATFKTITPQQANELMKTTKDLAIVDIRGFEELREGWIDGSTLMPMTDILQGRIAPPKDRPVLLICAVGGRSLGLGKAMTSYGWTMVYNLQGGIAEWKRQGLPVRY